MSSSYGNKLARALIASQANLRSCKSIKITFNPWQLETKSLRNFYHYINGNKIRLSNDKCKIASDIKSEQCEPSLAITFSKFFNLIFELNQK